VLGGIVNDAVLERLASAAGTGRVVVESRAVEHPAFPDAVVRTPTVHVVGADDSAAYARECFGPVAYVVKTGSTQESVELFGRTSQEAGAMTASVYSSDEAVLLAVREAALDVGVALSENLTGQVFVNQSAAFSDFHGTGANPSANATFTDGAYVASRFRMIQSRRPV
jgi:acyl-CoA reductase-like NAD-dependent aldehyde dehydrogenase